MEAEQIFAGLNGDDICAIKNVQELIDMGLDKDSATYYFNVFQVLKITGVPEELLKPKDTNTKIKNKK
jgi:ferritin-like protein